MGEIRDIVFEPGVVKDDTILTAGKKGGKRRWSDSNRIRFVAGLPQKLGGWAAFSTNTFTGICRGLLSWMDANNVVRSIIGTDKKLMVMEATTITNITPARATGTLGNDPFAMTSGSATVTVTHASHGAAAGDYVEYDGAAAAAGITVDGNYVIATVPSVNSYTITHSAAATSTASGGGAAVTYAYEIAVGRTDGASGDGYGVGAYGVGTYGTARSTYILFPPRVWSVDQWGQYVLAMPIDGNLYEWQNDISARALIVSNAPTGNSGFFVTAEKHVVVLDASSTQMLVKWSDQDDNTVWTATDQNTAGSRNLQGGTELLQGMRTDRTNLLLSDSSVWTMTFIGDEDVFGFDQVAAGASGGISPHCAVVVDGIAYWMGRNDFYFYDGVVRRMPNSRDIRRHVFDNLVLLQKHKVNAVVNSLYSEIWWFYSTATEIDKYVKYNWEDKVWDVGSLVRTAGMDVGVYDNPIMAFTDGYLYKHESGTTDAGAAMAEHIESAPFALGAGNRVIDVYSIYPDFLNLAGTIRVSLLTREYSQGSSTEESISDVTSATETADVRASGRQAQFRITSTTTNAHWRLGVPKFEVGEGGRN